MDDSGMAAIVSSPLVLPLSHATAWPLMGISPSWAVVRAELLVPKKSPVGVEVDRFIERNVTGEGAGAGGDVAAKSRRAGTLIGDGDVTADRYATGTDHKRSVARTSVRIIGRYGGKTDTERAGGWADGSIALSWSVPWLIVVGPRYRFMPANTSVPVPVLVCPGQTGSVRGRLLRVSDEVADEMTSGGVCEHVTGCPRPSVVRPALPAETFLPTKSLGPEFRRIKGRKILLVGKFSNPDQPRARAKIGLVFGTASANTTRETMNSLAKTADASRQVLTEQSISAAGPGTILRDVETLIDFIGERGLVTKSRQGNLPADVLPELNTRLAPSVELDLKRPLLRDYPNIAGVFVLLRVMELARVDGNRLRIDAEMLAVWRGLNPVEQYFALLEAWLFDADAGVLGAADRREQDQYSSNLIFLTVLGASRWKSFNEHCHLYRFEGTVSAWNTQLHLRFGLVEVAPRSLKNRTGFNHGWCMEKARRTPWGGAVAWAILNSVKGGDDDLLSLLRQSEEADFGSLQPVFRPYFPAWEKVFAPPRPDTQSGVHVFKVCFADHRVPGDVWCRLAVPGNASLYEVAAALLKAFKFSDTEHLYEFRYRDRSGKGRACFHPGDDEGPYADEVAVGDTGLVLNGTMKFLFDYGDSWRFELRLECIEPPVKEDAPIRVIEKTGKPPKQNPDWD